MTTTTADRGVTVGKALRAAARRLNAAQVDSSHLVAQALLAHTLELDHAQLLARLERPLPIDQLGSFQTLVERCESGEPLAYVLGQREFYALDFLVDRRVLIPRPETELLVETAIRIARARSETRMTRHSIADIGTGCGAIAVTLAVHLPSARLTATDISPDAIDVASQNARRHQVADRITFQIGDLLEPIDTPVDLIAANLPYVRSTECAHLAQSIRYYEPAIAFDGGSDGLEVVSRLLRQAPCVLRPGGSILLEIGAAHGEAALELARDCFPHADIAIRVDYAGVDRLLVVQTP